MNCNACGRPGYQHCTFSRDDMETMWAQGIVLSICDASDPDGDVIACTTISKSNPDNPSSIEELKEISS